MKEHKLEESYIEYCRRSDWINFVNTARPDSQSFGNATTGDDEADLIWDKRSRCMRILKQKGQDNLLMIGLKSGRWVRFYGDEGDLDFSEEELLIYDSDPEHYDCGIDLNEVPGSTTVELLTGIDVEPYPSPLDRLLCPSEKLFPRNHIKTIKGANT